MEGHITIEEHLKYIKQFIDDSVRRAFRDNIHKSDVAGKLSSDSKPPEARGPPDYLNPKDAARYCGFSPSTFAKLRMSGGGPEFIKTSRLVFYKRTELDEWLLARRCHSTSQYESEHVDRKTV